MTMSEERLTEISNAFHAGRFNGNDAGDLLAHAYDLAAELTRLRAPVTEGEVKQAVKQMRDWAAVCRSGELFDRAKDADGYADLLTRLAAENRRLSTLAHEWERSLRITENDFIAVCKGRDAVRSALMEILVAVTFAEPREFGPAEDRFLGYEARVPMEFVTIARSALAASVSEPQVGS